LLDADGDSVRAALKQVGLRRLVRRCGHHVGAVV
jgi:hypothetical protein